MTRYGRCNNCEDTLTCKKCGYKDHMDSTSLFWVTMGKGGLLALVSMLAFFTWWIWTSYASDAQRLETLLADPLVTIDQDNLDRRDYEGRDHIRDRTYRPGMISVEELAHTQECGDCSKALKAMREVRDAIVNHRREGHGGTD
jgi:hypothetical protein